MSACYTVALIGGRGYTGASLLPLIAQHPSLELAVATSTQAEATPLTEIDPNWPDPAQTLTALGADEVAKVAADVWILALPNGASEPWVDAIAAHHPQAVIVDLGADYRFQCAPVAKKDAHPMDWVYGLSEWQRDGLSGALRIANPGCYATAAQLALHPLRAHLAARPVVFGVSGYSGAGKTPSEKNDPKRLADNLIPYQLTGHMHERELSYHLGQPVAFHPHVAPFFRGLSVTVHCVLDTAWTSEDGMAVYEATYAEAPLVSVSREIPEIREVRQTPTARVGGFCVDEKDPHHAVVVVVLDNLLKGAASQAIQNINLALGLSEYEGLGVGQ